ncbi:Fic family protein [Massilia sp. BJB1822]|nr:Fic family protein [Massilia sp. BJB1822]
MFQDVYEWAGELRTVKISKDRSLFAAPEFIEAEAAKLFGQLRKEKFLTGLSRENFISRLAYFYGELNVLHPFREGNGRSQRLLFELMALHAGFALNWAAMNKTLWIDANIAAYNRQPAPLTALFEAITIKLP